MADSTTPHGTAAGVQCRVYHSYTIASTPASAGCVQHIQHQTFYLALLGDRSFRCQPTTTAGHDLSISNNNNNNNNLPTAIQTFLVSIAAKYKLVEIGLRIDILFTSSAAIQCFMPALGIDTTLPLCCSLEAMVVWMEKVGFERLMQLVCLCRLALCAKMISL